MEKEHELEQILEKLWQGEIDITKAQQQILVLFSVVGRSEQLSLCQCDNPSPDIMYGETCTECCLEIDPKT